MTYQAICVHPDPHEHVRRGVEYTCQPTSTPGMVAIPGKTVLFSEARFRPLAAPQATTPAPAPDEAPVAPAEGLAGTLAARGSRYGSFETNGSIAQEIKRTMRSAPKWGELTGAQAEALDMFASKISRMLTGDPDYSDNWHDIAGYATLVEDTLSKN